MTTIKLTHANLNSVIYVVRELIAAYYHSPANACTHVVASGGAIFPAKETVDEINRLLNVVQEVQNGTTEG